MSQAHTALEQQEPTRAPMTGLRHSNPWIFGTMLLSASFSLVAAFVLSWDALKLAADPLAELSCNINAVLSCGTVGLSNQAALFGFPNAFLGMMTEPVVITIAVAGLSGVRFPRWFMFTAQAIYLLGLIFAYWLFYQSMFNIGALCPWCLVITVGTTLVFMTLLHYNIRENNLYLPPAAQERAESFVRSDADLFVTIGWMLLLTALVVVKYGAAIFG
ncbi:MAG: vitamin K epoxide reductase family protein [Cellulomonadaceae bacterium]